MRHFVVYEKLMERGNSSMKAKEIMETTKTETKVTDIRDNVQGCL